MKVKHLKIKCQKCGHEQYEEEGLREDGIVCVYCNHIIKSIKFEPRRMKPKPDKVIRNEMF